MSVFIGFIIKQRGSPTLPSVQLAISANAMVCMFMRQEFIINGLYHVFTSIPLSFPLCFRRFCSLVFHYGGLHSGCGTAATVWLILYTVLATKAMVEAPSSSTISTVVTSYIVVSMFVFIIVGAHPQLRFKKHDYFEIVHRYSGWTALVTLWAHTVLTTANEPGRTVSLGVAILTSPGFWMLTASTCVVLINWGHLRLRDVRAEVLSSHATRLHFNYRNTNTCYAIRLSHNPVKDWHSFATIPDENGGFSVIVSNAGDWTKRTIDQPPTKIWVRGWPILGLHFTAKLFRRTVLVATGSGIGPILSLIHPGDLNCRIIWSTPNPETTYGDGIINSIYKADRNAIIWNTRTKGRPDLVHLIYQLYVEHNAEAVIIVSNPKVTRKVVYGLESRGIHAYGSLFDQ